MWLHIAVFLGGVCLSSGVQLLLKKSAQMEYGSLLREYLNAKVLIAFTAFFVATVCTVFAYARIPLSLSGMLSSSDYLFVVAMGRVALGEKISRTRVVNLALIVDGMILFSA